MLLVSPKGEQFQVARQLGRGGEGTAFLLGNAPGYVAKVYHQPLSDSQVQKLQIMAGMCDNVLLSNAAWPVAVVSRSGERKPCGFIMPFASGHELHEVYGPASRKHKLPAVTWDHLILVARNAACAFDTVHRRNVVVGDVNEKNLFVREDGRVVLVDCDSCQITRDGRIYPCRVGVPLYTPPELQGQHLSQVQRSSNHDTFGLAVLIFQLLFMGRHPFAGVTRDAQYLAIENGDAIRNGLYAFGNGAAAVGVMPPPHSLPISAVTSELQAFFEAAFSRNGGTSGRPSANQWIQVLENLRQRLVTCRAEKSHKYSNHLAACPWCALARSSGVQFFVCVSFAGYIEVTGDDVAAFRKAIDQLTATPLEVRDLDSFAKQVVPKPVPIPGNAKGPSGAFFGGILVVIASIFIGFAFPLAFLGVFWGLGLISSGRRKPEYAAEHSRRRSRRDQCQQQAASLHAELRSTATGYHAAFARNKSLLEEAYRRYANLPQERQREMAVLEQRKRQVQFDAFLERFLIAKHKIREIGPAREAMLISYGVETAADITDAKVKVIPGFKHHLFNVLTEWRRSCEKRFVFDPNKPIPQAEVEALNRRLLNLRTELQERQRNLLRETVDRGNRAKAQIADMSSRLEVLCRELKQAQADLLLFGV
jgi:DNA-binding helix-hairpin-helix protein with protein kinase domain